MRRRKRSLSADRERILLKLGLAEPQNMYLFPETLAQKTKVRFPELDGE